MFRDPVNGSHVPVPGLLVDIAIENENESSGSEEVDPQPGPLLWPDLVTVSCSRQEQDCGRRGGLAQVQAGLPGDDPGNSHIDSHTDIPGRDCGMK